MDSGPVVRVFYFTYFKNVQNFLSRKFSLIFQHRLCQIFLGVSLVVLGIESSKIETRFTSSGLHAFHQLVNFM